MKQITVQPDCRGWIRVAEQLPEVFVDVLIWTDGACVAGYIEPDREWAVTNQTCGIGDALCVSAHLANEFDFQIPTHWMPKPEAPIELDGDAQ